MDSQGYLNLKTCGAGNQLYPSVGYAIQMTAAGQSKNLLTLGFLVATVFFFATTLFGSFFIIIVLINEMDVPADMAPNIFMLGLVPPSVLTFLLFTKVFGRFL
jgi:hypothetical protein